MATPVLMPRQGNSVESCIIVSWKKGPGDTVTKGEIVCEVETDKAVFEVESPDEGILLTRFFDEGDDVPVLTNIAVIGAAGESPDDFRPEQGTKSAVLEKPPTEVRTTAAAVPTGQPAPAGGGRVGVSPRARRLAGEKGIDPAALTGSGPGARVIERDVVAALQGRQPMTPAALAMGPRGAAAAWGTAIGGRVGASDMRAAVPSASASAAREVPVRGMRKLIGDRMLASLQTTAQLTLNASADATALLRLRRRFKSSAERHGMGGVTINDLLLFITARVLREHPSLNAVMEGETIRQYAGVDLGFAVDTPRGLMVPVIRRADLLTPRELAAQTVRLAQACLDGNINPDELNGGTFTLTNMGSLGVETFTPVLNAPQVAILGVGGVRLQPMRSDGGEIEFVDTISLSLTIDHRAVDGAPGAHFLKAVAEAIVDVDVMLIAAADPTNRQ